MSKGKKMGTALTLIIVIFTLLLLPVNSFADYGVLSLRILCSKQTDTIEIEPFMAWLDGGKKYKDFDADKAITNRYLRKKDVTYYSFDKGYSMNHTCKTIKRTAKISVKDGVVAISIHGKKILDGIHIGNADDYNTNTEFYFIIKSDSGGEWKECYGYKNSIPPQCEPIEYKGATGGYMLVGGRDRAVCREYNKNLNSFGTLPYPMSCERKLNSQFTKFTKPVWKKLDVWENREKIKKVHIKKWYRGGLDKLDENLFLNRLKEDIKNKTVSIHEAWIDINNDGKMKHVMKYTWGVCKEEKQENVLPWGWSMFVWNDKSNGMDSSMDIGDDNLDIFFYQGKTFFDQFVEEVNSQDGTIRIGDYGRHGLIMNDCIFKYEKRGRNK